jgi:hypothetical protein
LPSSSLRIPLLAVVAALALAAPATPMTQYSVVWVER